MVDYLALRSPPVVGAIIIGYLSRMACIGISGLNGIQPRVAFHQIPVTGHNHWKITGILAVYRAHDEGNLIGARVVQAQMRVKQEELLIRGFVRHDGPGGGLRNMVCHRREITAGSIGRGGMPEGTGTVEGDEVGPVQNGGGFLTSLGARDKTPVAVIGKNILALLTAKSIVAIAAAVIQDVPHLLFLCLLQADNGRAVIIDHGVVGALAVGPVTVVGVRIAGFTTGRCKTHVGRHYHQSLRNLKRLGGVVLACKRIHLSSLGRERTACGEGHLGSVRSIHRKAHPACVSLRWNQKEHAATEVLSLTVCIYYNAGRCPGCGSEGAEIGCERTAHLLASQALEHHRGNLCIISAWNSELYNAHKRREVQGGGTAAPRHHKGRCIVSSQRHLLGCGQCYPGAPVTVIGQFGSGISKIIRRGQSACHIESGLIGSGIGRIRRQRLRSDAIH